MKTQKTTLPGIRMLFTAALALLAILNTRADYQSSVLNDSPLAYYALDLNIDNAGVATDLSGNDNNSTYYNIYPAAGPTAYIPNAATFDPGSESYVDLSTGNNPNALQFTGPTTLEAWVQAADSTTFGDVIAKGYYYDPVTGGYPEIALRENGGNGANYYGYFGNGAVSGGQQNTNWSYLVLSNDGTNTSLYVNGALVQSTADTVGSITFPIVVPWAIGNGSSSGYGRFFNGNICQAAIYNHGLSAAQVLNHYYQAELNASPDTSVPIINTQPQSQASYVGGSVTFTVGAVSGLPTTNQWFKDGDPINGQTNSTLILTNLQLDEVGNYQVVIGNANGTTNSALASLSVSTPSSLSWSANANSGVWDTGSSANWINQANSQQTVFTTGDEVLFDDTVGVPTTVSVNGTVASSVITVNSDVNNFLFNGSGTITGSGSLIKKGASTLTLNGAANFTGPVTISGGSVYAGDYSFTSVSSITITNNATLDFAGGQLTGNKPVYVSGSGVDGLGALINSSYEIYGGNALAITLTGDATFGGSSRWDLGVGSTLTGPYKVTINRSSGVYGEWNTVSLANNVGDIELAGGKLGIVNMGTTFGNPESTVMVDAGTELDFWSGSGYAKNIHVLTNGLLQILTGFTHFDANFTLDNGAKFSAFYGSGDQVMSGAFTLNGIFHLVLGDGNFIFTNVISGPGGFVWDAYNHLMILQAANTYSGPTVIGGGLTLALTEDGSISDSSLIFFGGTDASAVHLDASGRSDETLTLAGGQTLAGIGAVAGNLVVSADAALAPAGTNTTLDITSGANATGTISATNNILLNGTALIKLNGSGTNDIVQAGGGITYGGTLNLVNISGTPLAAGDSFQIFNAVSYSGSFGGNIIPATPGAGLTWDLSQLDTGKISVAAEAGLTVSSTTVSGNSLILGGSGGAANGTYYVLATTNLTTPIADWIIVSTNLFDASGAFSATNAIDAATPQQFYRIEQP